MPYVRRRHHMSVEKKAAFFGLFLLTVLCLSLAMVAANASPLVLGTEMNTNGQVEYLCLGKGCEAIY